MAGKAFSPDGPFSLVVHVGAAAGGFEVPGGELEADLGNDVDGLHRERR
jgi:hypothetical protein